MAKGQAPGVVSSIISFCLYLFGLLVTDEGTTFNFPFVRYLF
jgi:hypothetical protein